MSRWKANFGICRPFASDLRKRWNNIYFRHFSENHFITQIKGFKIMTMMDSHSIWQYVSSRMAIHYSNLSSTPPAEYSNLVKVQEIWPRSLAWSSSYDIKGNFKDAAVKHVRCCRLLSLDVQFAVGVSIKVSSKAALSWSWDGFLGPLNGGNMARSIDA